MHGNKLRKRMIAIKASKTPMRASLGRVPRREGNKTIKEESHPNDEFNSFFDFEDEFLNTKPSRELFDSVVEQGSEGVFLEEIKVTDGNEPYGVTLEEIPIVNSDNNYSLGKSSEILEDSLCMFFDYENIRCSDDKDSGSIFCKNHQHV